MKSQHRKPSRIALISVLSLFTLSAFALEDFGTFSLDLRTRYETAEKDGLKDGDNLSLRIRPGFTTKVMNGFQFMIEGEFTGINDKDDYHAAGVHGDPARAAIADPENAQLEQAWLSYAGENFSLKGGRQVIAYDGQRWVGHVGWRQNRQTFDAFSLQVDPIENLTLNYAYIDKAIRIFGDEAPDMGGNAEDFNSDSHLFRASYKSDIGNFTGYVYALDLENAPGKIAGSNTVGLSYGKTINVTETLPVGIYLEYANQRDAADNVNDYSADYIHARINGSVSALSYEIGYEVLGSDSTDSGYAAVQTPFATGHKFNGFADLFLVTPDKGLEDAYIMLGYKWDLGSLGPLITKVWYHDFQSHRGGALGDEFDAVIVKPIPIPDLPGSLSVLAKYADYSAPSGSADVERTSLEFNYSLSF